MRFKLALSSALFGLAAGAALSAAAPLASDPTPTAGKHGEGQQHRPSHPEGGGRWHSEHGPDRHAGHAPHGANGHASEAGHEGHGSAPEIAFRGCAFFENESFTGRRGDLPDGASVEWLGRDWSDRISSTACHPGCRLIGYVDINYGGARRNFIGAVSRLGPDWNDRISAVRAVCPGGPHPEQHQAR